MAKVSVLNVAVLENPSPFHSPFRFEISFECSEALADGELGPYGDVSPWRASQWPTDLSGRTLSPLPWVRATLAGGRPKCSHSPPRSRRSVICSAQTPTSPGEKCSPPFAGETLGRPSLPPPLSPPGNLCCDDDLVFPVKTSLPWHWPCLSV